MVLDGGHHGDSGDRVEAMQQDSLPPDPPVAVETNLSYMPGGSDQYMDPQGIIISSSPHTISSSPHTIGSVR